MAAGDWIKLHRKLLESAVFNDEWLLRLWIWCLLRAGYCDRTVAGTTIHAGSFVTGRFAASDELNVSPSRWYRGIHQLASLGMISLSASQERTTITICKWDTYQSDSDVREQQVNNQRTASEQPADSITPPEVYRNAVFLNNERTTSEQQADTRKEGKEYKEEPPIAPQGARESRADNGYCQSFLDWWAVYPKKSGKEAAFKAWVKAGGKIKKRTLCSSQEAAEFLLKVVTAYAEARKTEDPQFTLNPATWLNQGHYDDDQTTWRKQQPPASSRVADIPTGGTPVFNAETGEIVLAKETK